MSAHPVRWQAPQPLWARFGVTVAAAATADDQSRPAILRFATDDFMPQMLGTLARDPARIDQLVARPETWRSPGGATVDLLERTQVPRLAQSASRQTLGKASRTAVAATTAEASLAHGARTVVRPLKLYQPAHQRFYLISASLVCAVPGLPERAVVPGGAEQLHYVIRRLLPDTPEDTSGVRREYALVKDDEGARWQRVTRDADAAQLVANEELLPVFPLAFEDEGARTRKLWTGLVPVGRREEYMAAAVERTPAPSLTDAQQLAVRAPAAPAPKRSKQARLTQFQMEVAEPWKNLIRAAYSTVATLNEPPTTGAGATVDEKREQVFKFALKQQHPSWLVLLDFADFLDTHLHDVWTAIDGSGSAASLTGDRKALYDWLGTAKMSATLSNALISPTSGVTGPAPATSLRSALLRIRAAGVRENLEAAELAYAPATMDVADAGWPPFHFVLAGIGTTLPATGVHAAEGPFTALATLPAATAVEVQPEPTTALVAPGTVEEATAWLDRLTALVGRGLVADVETTAPPLPFAVQMRNALNSTVDDPGWFVARFVYTRRDCGPLHLPLLSAATQRFQLASFFDPDAPARPIRIALPLDTSPAGLRKFPKNTAFVVSDMLCGQMQRAKGMGLLDLVRAVLPWPLHKDLEVGEGGPCNGGGINIGMICSLSIPIITICALIMLMIIVSLLDLVFRWLPFFAICFPVLNFKAKKGAS